MTKTLIDCRKEIDDIDDKLFELLIARNQVSLDIADIKIASGDMSVYKPEREAQIIDRLSEKTKAEHEKTMVQNVWNEIMKNSRLTQLQYMVNRLR